MQLFLWSQHLVPVCVCVCVCVCGGGGGGGGGIRCHDHKNSCKETKCPWGHEKLSQ